MLDPQLLEKQITQERLPPVDQWNPEFCGDMDIIIKRDGTWLYMGTPISRQKMVHLFSTILRQEEDEYFLVTPVEKVRIKVEDAPFVVLHLETKYANGVQQLVFTDNVGNRFIAGEEHPITVKTDPETLQPAPYVIVRKNLKALIHRNVFYEMVELATMCTQNGKQGLTIESDGVEFYLGDIDA